MRRLLWLAPLLFFVFARPAAAQYPNAQGFCEAGAESVVTSGLQSTTQVQASFPACTVTVNVHGGGAATIYSNDSGTPLSNPFTAQLNGQWQFFAATGSYDITLTCLFPSCTAPTPSPFPILFSEVGIGGAGSVTGVTSFNTRTGVVTSQTGDYTCAEVTGCVTGGGGPGLPLNSLQYNFGTMLTGAPGITTPDGNSLIIKGIEPWTSITAFGAVAVDPQFNIVESAACTAGSTAVTLIGGAPMQNGWGVHIQGCGLTETMGAPALAGGTAFVQAAAGTSAYDTAVLGVSGNAPPAGSSTYTIATFGRDIYGGLTPVSATVTLTTGPAALGEVTLPTGTLSLSNNTITVTTTGTQSLAVGAEVHLSGSSNATFSGWFNTSTVNNAGNSFTIANTQIDSRVLGAQSATGGQVTYYNGLYIAPYTPSGTSSVAYYICEKRPGDSSLHVVGETAPLNWDGTGYASNAFYDWGPTLQGNNTFPSYVTDAACTSGTGLNDPLTTTIVSGGGTANLVMANAASNTSAYTPIEFDDEPAIQAALDYCNFQSPAFNGCPVYIPAVPAYGARKYYIINSYLKVPPGSNIFQDGSLYLNETIELPSIFHWRGDWIAGPVGNFGIGTGSQVTVNAAMPGVISIGGQQAETSHLMFNSVGTNGGILFVADNPYNQSWSYDSFDTNSDGNGDYCGLGLMLRSTTTGGNPFYIDHTTFSGGPAQITDSTWCPLLSFPGDSSTATGPESLGNNFIGKLDHTFFVRRGIQLQTYGGPGNHLTFTGTYRQGGLPPFLTVQNQTGAISEITNISHSLQDTETSSTVAYLGLNGNGFSGATITDLDDLANGSVETGGTPPAVTGSQPGYVFQTNPQFRATNNNTISEDSTGLHSTLSQNYPQTFALLPASPGPGTMAFITDSPVNTLGSNVTVGGGTNKIGVGYNGTNWVVVWNGSSSGSSGISGQAAGVIPLASTSTTIGAQSHCDDGNSTAATVTCSEPITSTNVITATRFISNISTGTAPLGITSTTVVPNLNVSLLLGGTWAVPGTIGSTTPNSGAFTTLLATGAFTSNVTGGGVQCLHASNTGVVTGAGGDCSTGGTQGGTTSSPFIPYANGTNTLANSNLECTTDVTLCDQMSAAVGVSSIHMGSAASAAVSGYWAGASPSTGNRAALFVTSTYASVGVGDTSDVRTAYLSTVLGHPDLVFAGISGVAYLGAPAAAGTACEGLLPSSNPSGANIPLVTAAVSGSGPGTCQWSYGQTSLTGGVTGILPVANGGSGQATYTPTLIIASGTSALNTSAIGSGSCATLVTGTATGAATTDNLTADFNADPTSTTGYGPNATTGILTLYKYLTANTVNFKVCNSTSASITPGSATLQWRVIR
jgi:hypothetical protein